MIGLDYVGRVTVAFVGRLPYGGCLYALVCSKDIRDVVVFEGYPCSNFLSIARSIQRFVYSSSSVNSHLVRSGPRSAEAETVALMLSTRVSGTELDPVLTLKARAEEMGQFHKHQVYDKVKD